MSSENKIWRVRKGPKIFGPMTKTQVEQLIATHRVDEQDQISAGGDTWVPVSQFLREQGLVKPGPIRATSGAPSPGTDFEDVDRLLAQMEPLPESAPPAPASPPPALAPPPPPPLVRSGPRPVPRAEPQAAPIPLAKWTYTRHGKAVGKASEAELRMLLESGKLKHTDLVWQDGMAAPVMAGTVVRYNPPLNREGGANQPLLENAQSLVWLIAILMGILLAGLVVGALWALSVWPFTRG